MVLLAEVHGEVVEDHVVEAMAVEMLSTEAMAYEIAQTGNQEHLRVLREGVRAAERLAVVDGSFTRDPPHGHDVAAAHPVFQLVQRAFGQDGSVIDDAEPVAQPLGLVQVVRGVHHGRAAAGD